MQAQDRLRAMPGYDQFQKMQAAMQGGPAVVSGAVLPAWAEDGKSFSYSTGGKAYKFDLTAMRAEVTGDAPAAGAGRGAGPGRAGGAPPAGGRQGGGGRGAGQLPAGTPNPCPPEVVERGRQAACAPSPDGKMKAYYRDRNLFVSNADGSGEVAVTTDGNEKARIKYGVASWVYGEELDQTSAIWWAPDSRKVGFYRFDESKVKDYFIQMEQTKVQVSLDTGGLSQGRDGQSRGRRARL
jgi:dipeptidyl-peptidase-4